MKRKPLEEMGFKINFTCKNTYVQTINSKEGVEKVRKASIAILGEDNVKDYFKPKHYGEDFSYYLQKIPGAFFFLGNRNIEKGIIEPQHSPRFKVDEDAIALYLDFLNIFTALLQLFGIFGNDD